MVQYSSRLHWFKKLLKPPLGGMLQGDQISPGPGESYTRIKSSRLHCQNQESPTDV